MKGHPGEKATSLAEEVASRVAAVRRAGTGADLVERSAAAEALETAALEAAVSIIPGILDHWSP